VSISVQARGSGLTYQWQVSSNGGETWANTTATGATTATISGFEVTEARIGNQDRCKVILPPSSAMKATPWSATPTTPGAIPSP